LGPIFVLKFDAISEWSQPVVGTGTRVQYPLLGVFGVGRRTVVGAAVGVAHDDGAKFHAISVSPNPLQRNVIITLMI